MDESQSESEASGRRFLGAMMRGLGGKKAMGVCYTKIGSSE